MRAIDVSLRKVRLDVAADRRSGGCSSTCFILCTARSRDTALRFPIIARIGLLGIDADIRSNGAGVAAVIFSPVCDVGDLREEEDAFALRFGGRVHDPDRVWVLLEFDFEEAVICWKGIRGGGGV